MSEEVCRICGKAWVYTGPGHAHESHHAALFEAEQTIEAARHLIELALTPTTQPAGSERWDRLARTFLKNHPSKSAPDEKTGSTSVKSGDGPYPGEDSRSASNTGADDPIVGRGHRVHEP